MEMTPWLFARQW